MTTDSDERLDRKAAEEQTRKPYATPKLIVHGSAERITQAGGGQGADIQMGSVIDLVIKA
ncbi:hypothetical protein AMJ85_01930 [candidate division BRC1 bacterium SM23_51]|nr:MAG: hypothetical protein AMJ85_01930 [candidate division BRC1 bacterium SM23_51]